MRNASEKQKRQPPLKSQLQKRGLQAVDILLSCLRLLPGLLLLSLLLLSDNRFFANIEVLPSSTVSASNAASTATSGQFVPPYKHSSVSTDSQEPDQPIPGTTRAWEHRQGDIGPPEGVKGKLKTCLPYWKNVLKASEFVIDVIESGYKIPFVETPPPFYAKNNRSSLDHPEFVKSAILDLLRKHCIAEVDTPPHCCNPLTVAKGKKLRLVLDLRHPNQFIFKTKFKYEDLRHISKVLDSNQHYFSFDLESGYHHVDIFPTHQTYLGFAWHFEQSRPKYFVFCVLPFGLSSACYLFTKLTRPLVYHWRAQGISSFMYIDDGLIISPNLDSALRNSVTVKESVIHSGFVPSKTKCFWQPHTSITFLGLVIDSTTLTFSVPSAKVAKLKEIVHDALSDHHHAKPIQVRLLARVTGKIVSMTLALGPVTRLMTRAMYRSIEDRNFWSDCLYISESVAVELKFWLSNLDAHNGFSIRHQHTPSRAVYSDASDTGYGGYVVGFPALNLSGSWSKSEQSRSSTWRELAAVLRMLQELCVEFEHEKVRWYTDNANVPRILVHGSTKPDLHHLALAIFSLSLKHNLVILPEWVPRNLNTIADSISRVSDYDDWSIDQPTFALIDELWGPHTIDRFASPTNHRVKKFNSRFWCRDTAGVDAFCHDWSGDNNYLCPPVSLIVHTLKHLSKCHGRGTLIVPKWTSAFFWPSICPDGNHLHNSIQDWRLLNISFTPPLITPNSVFNNAPNFLSLALRFDHRFLPRETLKGFCCSELGYCQKCLCFDA